MLQIVLCLLLIVVHLLLFLLFGTEIGKLFKLKQNGLETILIGFFGYFTLFQIVYSPFLLLKSSFTSLVIAWSIISILLIAFILFHSHADISMNLESIPKELFIHPRPLVLVVLIPLVLMVLYHAISYYAGFDTSFYIGTINTTLYTDTMYQFNGETGILESVLDMRYAMSGFYTNTAFWCKLLSLPPIMAQKYTMGSLCIILYAVVTFMIGSKIFKKEGKQVYTFTSVALLLNFLFLTVYSTSSFLLARGYEAKGYCANVIFPAFFYMALCIWGDVKEVRNWKILFLIALASIPISMSSILIIPVLIFILSLAEWIVSKKFQIMLQGVVCLLPNVAYLLLFFLFWQRLWIVAV